MIVSDGQPGLRLSRPKGSSHSSFLRSFCRRPRRRPPIWLVACLHQARRLSKAFLAVGQMTCRDLRLKGLKWVARNLSKGKSSSEREIQRTVFCACSAVRSTCFENSMATPSFSAELAPGSLSGKWASSKTARVARLLEPPVKLRLKFSRRLSSSMKSSARRKPPAARAQAAASGGEHASLGASGASSAVVRRRAGGRSWDRRGGGIQGRTG